MNDYKETLGAVVGNVISLTGVGLSTSDVESIVSIVCSIVGLIVTITSVIISVVRWWKKSSKDGKIDEDEIKELQDIVDKTKDELTKKDEKDE